MNGTRLLSGAAALLLLGAGACGDDDSDGASPFGPADAEISSGSGERDNDVNACLLLERTEIEAQLGEVGAVGEGQEDIARSCLWEVGTNGDSVSVLVLPHRPDQSLEDAVTGDGAVDIELTPVAGIGDEALLDDSEGFPFVFVRSGDTIVSVSALLVSDVTGAEDKLLALAELVVRRL